MWKTETAVSVAEMRGGWEPGIGGAGAATRNRVEEKPNGIEEKYDGQERV